MPALPALSASSKYWAQTCCVRAIFFLDAREFLMQMRDVGIYYCDEFNIL